MSRAQLAARPGQEHDEWLRRFPRLDAGRSIHAF